MPFSLLTAFALALPIVALAEATIVPGLMLLVCTSTSTTLFEARFDHLQVVVTE